MPGSTDPVLFGADYFGGRPSKSSWASIHQFGFGSGEGPYVLQHMTLNGGTISIDDADTILAVDDVSLLHYDLFGINTPPNGSYNSNFNNIRGVGTGTNMGEMAIEGGIVGAHTITAWVVAFSVIISTMLM